MSLEQAQALVRRTATDPDFRARLDNAPIEDRRAILEAEGYGDVKLSHLSKALPESAGGELSDDEFLAVAGGNATTAITISVAGSAASGAVGTAAVAVAALA